MNLKELASKIAKDEGLKTQVSVGNIREIVGLLSDEIKKDPSLAVLLLQNGDRRAKRKKAK
jgi:hypothetical protein